MFKKLALALALSLTQGLSAATEKPNILIIYADDIGYGDLSCYGGTGAQTPFIDRLANDGIRFSSGYASAATCTPSRYSLLTGEYAFRNKSAKILPGNAPLIIDPAKPNIASFMKGAGYKTALVGKWHLGLGLSDGSFDWNSNIKPAPRELGFDYSFYMAATGDRVPSVYIENSEVVDLDPSDPIKVSYAKPVGTEPTGISHPHLLTVQADVQHAGTIVNGISRIGTMTGGHAARFKDEDMADTYLNKAIDFINKSKDQPFFMYFAAHDNHVPRRPHPRFQGSSSLGPRGDAIVQFDWTVGKLIKTLKANKMYRNTLIILSSDNGPVLFDGYWEGSEARNGDHKAAGPFRGGKYSLWEGGTRMPFIVSWPGKIQSGTSSALISQVDIFASIATLIGKDLPKGASPDGKNMLPALMGQSPVGRDYLVEEALSQVALRMGDWKYIPPGTVTERGGLDEWIKTPVHPPGMLFNLADDPGETNDLSKQHPKRVKAMLAILKKEAPSKFLNKKTPGASQLGFE